MRIYVIIGILVFILMSCGVGDDLPLNGDLDHRAIVNILEQGFDQLPEKSISISSDSSTYAQYAMPTDKYAHAILGDGIEGEQLVVFNGGQFYDLILANDFVFEDIRPRLFDVDSDGQLEFITIRTHVSLGAGIAIYKLVNNELIEYATVDEIGSSNRWLNIAAIHDLDMDGVVEIAWVQTPHIGGILKVARINEGILQVIAQQTELSNHAIGETNLCLSVITEKNGEKLIHLPDQMRSLIASFSFTGEELVPIDTVFQAVDFSQTLKSQFDFVEIVADELNCIE